MKKGNTQQFLIRGFPLFHIKYIILTFLLIFFETITIYLTLLLFRSGALKCRDRTAKKGPPFNKSGRPLSQFLIAAFYKIIQKDL